MSGELLYVFGELRRALASRGDGRIPGWEIWGFELSLSPISSPQQIRGRAVILQDLKNPLYFFLAIIRSFVPPEAVVVLGVRWQREMEDPGGHGGRPGEARWAWMGSGVF